PGALAARLLDRPGAPAPRAGRDRPRCESPDVAGLPPAARSRGPRIHAALLRGGGRARRALAGRAGPPSRDRRALADGGGPAARAEPPALRGPRGSPRRGPGHD